MIKYQVEQELTLKKIYLNSFISDIKNELHSSSAISPIKEIDFYNILLEKDKIKKFISIVNLIQTERTIVRKNVRRFQIVANTRTFNGAGELNAKCGKRNASFSNAFKNYDSPIDYLESLKGIPQLEEIDYFKYFVAIDYTILNEHQLEVSGGERSEFNLLDKIQDAYQYDLLLIDEPESSFDNLFLKNEVNEQIKEISKYLPVVIVTHNNTVGASINPNYILYTKREIIENHPIFKIFSGLPSDSLLKSIDGETISNYNIILNCLEAGDAAYTERRKSYDVLKN
jgi:ABC-type dipeptide/oligopeptide/nickel transport system ATPase subunit